MKGGSALAVSLLLALLSSACELIAGIDDRKPAGAGSSGGDTEKPPTGGGGLAAGGAGGAGFGGGGTPGTGAAGGLPVLGGTAGGVAGGGGASGLAGRAGAGGGLTPGGSTGSGGLGGGGGSGSGGAKLDAAVDAPLGVDVAVCTGVPGTGNGLLGEYFSTTTLTPLRLSRLDPTVDFEWPAAPEWNLPADRFSVRWSGQVQPRYSGRYTFHTKADDGVKLWINDSLIVDDWESHAATEKSGAIDLVAGQRYSIKVEYFEYDGTASVQLAWSSNCQAREVVPPSQLYPPAATCGVPSLGTGTGIVGEYFDDANLGAVRVTRLDPMVSFSWPAGISPHPSISPTSFSVRWTGQVQATYSDWTTFYVTSDDGVRLFADDVPIIDNWIAHRPTQDSATVRTVAGQSYNLRLEYFQQDGDGQVDLAWGSVCQPRETIPQRQLSPTYVGMVCSDPAQGLGIGLRGDYYRNQTLTGAVVTHPAEAVNFDWGDGAPDAAIGADDFSARWTGQIMARHTGATTFRTLSDDGVRLWVDGQLVVDNWGDHQVVEDAGAVKLVAGHLYDIKLEFRDNLEKAVIKLLWYTPCHAAEVIPATYLYPPGYSGPDAGPDVGPDTGPDVGPDGGPDTGPDGGPDVGPDGAADAPADGEPDVELALDGGVDGA